MAQQTLKPALSYLDAAPNVPALAGLAVRFAAVVTQWRHRHATRQELRWLDDTQLHDVGLTRDQAYSEISKRFWQG